MIHDLGKYLSFTTSLFSDGDLVYFINPQQRLQGNAPCGDAYRLSQFGDSYNGGFLNATKYNVFNDQETYATLPVTLQNIFPTRDETIYTACCMTW